MTDSERLHCEAADYAHERMEKHKGADKKHSEDFYKGNWIAHYEGYIAGYNAKKKERAVHEMDYTVTLTAKDLAFRERARLAGIPSMAVSMYAEALQRLVEDERESCAKWADLVAREIDNTHNTASYIASGIRARGEK